MPTRATEMQYRQLGSTGERVSAIGVGGWHLGLPTVSEDLAIRIECLHYALSLPTSVVITGIDSMKILNQAFTALRTLPKFTDADRAALLDRTRKAAAKGKWEPFKTSSIFDGTAATPKWLGEEPARLRRIM